MTPRQPEHDRPDQHQDEDRSDRAGAPTPDDTDDDAMECADRANGEPDASEPDAGH